jgi:hypothetical protein
MSDLKDRLHLKQNAELIAILESKNAFTPEAVQYAAEIIQERFIEDEELISLVTKYWENELNDSLKSYLKSGVIPESNFLNEDQLKSIFAKKYQEYVERKEVLAVDSTLYWFAI